MNHAILIGRLGKDPEERITKAGHKGIFFPLAVDIYISKEKRTQWYTVIIWEESLFNLAKCLKKGDMGGVAGTLLPPTSYVNAQGETKINQSLKCSSLYFLPSPFKNIPEEEEEDSHAIFEY